MAGRVGGRARAGALLALLMAVPAACTLGGRGGGREPAVRFDQRGGDSFAWRQPVSGTTGCAAVALLVNGNPVPGAAVVPVKDGRFSADVSLAEGRNDVVARCTSGGRDAAARLSFTGRLAALKHRVPALNTGRINVLASDPGGSFAYLRPAPPGGRPVLVVLNFGPRVAVELTRTPALDAALAGRATLTDLLDDRPVRLEAGARSITVRMAAESAHVLTPEGG